MKRALAIGILTLMCSPGLPILEAAQTGRPGGAERYISINGSEISGTVKGKSGAGFSNATVIAKNKETGFVATIVTDDSGAFQFAGLPVGHYSLTALVSSLDQPIIEDKHSGGSPLLRFTRMTPRDFQKTFPFIQKPSPETQRPRAQPDQRKPSPENGTRGPLVITPHGLYL